MTAIIFTEDEYDQLKEIFNVAMGRAGSDLAVLLKSFVDLSVPDLEIVTAEKIAETILVKSVFTEEEPIVAFRQSFDGGALLAGEAMVFFDMDTKSRVASILGLPSQMESVEEIAFMFDMCNLLVGACLNSVSDQLFQQTASFSQPEMIAENRMLKKMVYETFMRTNLKWDYTLLVKISFQLKEKMLKSELMMFLAEPVISSVKKAVSEMLVEDEE